MATDTVKINDIASQLTTASRLVVSTDFFWVYMASGTQVKIPAEFVKAYLVNGIKPTVNSDGNWEIDGTDLGVAAKGKTPQFRGGAMGIEVSYDEGKTWATAVEYTAMDPDLESLAEAYTKVTENESERQAAEETRQSQESTRQTQEATRQSQESSRVTAEKARVTAESSRATAESTRESNESARKSNETARQTQETTRQNQEAARQTNEKTRQSNETARQTAETQRQTDTAAAISSSEAQTEIAKSYNEHPPKIGDNGNWWSWNGTEYADTGYPARGGTLYPTFYHTGNKLYIRDTTDTVAQYVKRKGNKVAFSIYEFKLANQ